MWDHHLFGSALRGGFDFPDGLLNNAGQCLPAAWANATRAELAEHIAAAAAAAAATPGCGFVRVAAAGVAAAGVAAAAGPRPGSSGGGEWWANRSVTDSTGAEWVERGCEGEAGAVCVPSFLTMASR